MPTGTEVDTVPGTGLPTGAPQGQDGPPPEGPAGTVDPSSPSDGTPKVPTAEEYQALVAERDSLQQKLGSTEGRLKSAREEAKTAKKLNEEVSSLRESVADIGRLQTDELEPEQYQQRRAAQQARDARRNVQSQREDIAVGILERLETVGIDPHAPDAWEKHPDVMAAVGRAGEINNAIAQNPAATIADVMALERSRNFVLDAIITSGTRTSPSGSNGAQPTGAEAGAEAPSGNKPGHRQINDGQGGAGVGTAPEDIIRRFNQGGENRPSIKEYKVARDALTKGKDFSVNF